MSNNIQRALGRIEVIDERDKEFPISAVLEQANPNQLPNISKKFWWADGWWGNQGSFSHCVAYAWMHCLEDGPIIQDALTESRSKPFYNPREFYDLCQLHDQWPGENYEGTSVRAGATILKSVGVLEVYRWATSLDDVIKSLKYIGPVVVGTRWYSDMNSPPFNGIISASGQPQGGHAYLLNGVDEERELFRIKNSWGRAWGKGGFAYITFDDFAKLLRQGGEACIGFEHKMDHIPELIMG
jgi:hypothetical protein